VNNDEIKRESDKFKLNVFFDRNKIEELVENLQNEFESYPINFDFNKLNESMAKLKSELKEMNIDTSNLRAEMKKLKSFSHEFKSELIKDGYVENEDDDFNMEFSKDELIVNDKTLPNNMLIKYKNIYKKHYGRKIEGKFRMKK